MNLKSKVIKAIHWQLNARQQPSFADIAKELGTSPRNLQRKLIKEYGETYTDIMIKIRTRRAIQYIKRTNLPLFRIAAELGYTEASAFYKLLKSTGKSPRDYRDVR